MKYLKCTKCGVVDKSTKRPRYIGTSETMVCPDCNIGKLNKYNKPLAEMCRNCCPTKHGTKVPGLHEGVVIMINVGNHKGKKGVVKRWHHDNVYTVEVMDTSTEIVLFDDGEEMITVYEHDKRFGLIP